ncbi:transcriptional regulator [Candidatus Shapirobacteria bacterium CG_4_9_14_3_um_filter_36_12]|uniref:Transcriptional regulator n=1 Tax=Candidatus Shapirobacteria bacterium CG_4_9_14_3_um_filter_36_12 TaxID=1974877 RepID=A0A2M7XPM1_9BACT|nr:MAG: transcriptional regulator [Candidatus Shapirobacteria bacterium CG_4_9_14_3_um_filter_36_12]
MDWQTHKKQLLNNPKFKKALTESSIEFQIVKSVIEARLKSGLTQSQLAKKMKTKQSVISRLENVKTIPSISFLKKLALATNSKLTVAFQ